MSGGPRTELGSSMHDDPLSIDIKTPGLPGLSLHTAFFPKKKSGFSCYVYAVKILVLSVGFTRFMGLDLRPSPMSLGNFF